MDRSALSGAIIAEMESVVRAALEEAVPHLLTVDLATTEQQAQQLGRVLLGRLIEAVVTQRGQTLPRPLRCTTCGGAVRERTRPRHLQGLVGDDRLQRAYHWCAGCGAGRAPRDEEIGLGPGVLSPGLARVVARAALAAPFTQASDQVQETLGVAVSREVVRRTAEEVGAGAAASVPAAIARARQGQPPWADAERASAPTTSLLAVELDGVLVQRDAGWHEMKVVTVAPLGPDVRVDARSGRTHVAWGPASYGAGVAGAEDFWWRAYVEAARRGLGTPAVRTVVVLGDGAAWIWERAAAFRGVGGTEVVEIVDIYHAYTPTAISGPWARRSSGRGARRPAPGSSRSRTTSTSRGPPPSWPRWPA